MSDGGCFGKKKTEDEKKAEAKSKAIDANIKLQKKKLQQFRLLLLGTGDAGKSTFSKQMSILHQNGFSQQKREATVPVLKMNCLESMKALLQAAEKWEEKIEKKHTSAAQAVLEATTLTPAIADHINALWMADSIKSVFKKGSQLQLPGGNSNVAYFFTHAQKFAKEGYIPSDADMLRAKQKTTGVSEIIFQVEEAEFVMVDVGGQRSERKKWLQCFNDVSAVIYLAAINEYDMKMEEDNVTNRMEESLKLFCKLSGSQWLSKIPFILFLNKCDLFKEKVETSPLVDHFEDYEAFSGQLSQVGRSDEEIGLDYIKQLYETAFQGQRLYTFQTCALDTDKCSKVFAAVRDNIVSKAIQFNI